MSKKEDVFVTGLGIVSPIGITVDSFWKSCIESKSNVKKIPDEWNHYSKYNSGIWSPLPDINFKEYGFSRLDLLQKDPVSLITLMASEEALKHANISSVVIDKKNKQFELNGIKSDKTGVFIGTAAGGVYSFLKNNACHMLDSFTSGLINEGTKIESIEKLVHPKKINPFVVSMLMANSIASSIGIKYSLHGVNRTITQACSSGTSAIGYAYQAIKSGQIDFAICGGAEYLYDDYGGIYKGYDIARVLANKHKNINQSNRPFDQERSGFLYSQGGSGVLILESRKSVEKRNADVLAQISGFAETFDAFSMMSISPDGQMIKKMIRNALSEGNLNLEDIDYINAHGTGTELNDEIESKVIEDLFIKKPLVNSTKSLTGHGLGVSGAIEAIVSVLSIQNQTTHICKNLKNPIRDLNFVITNNPHNIRHVLSESFAFGGHNAALVFSKVD